MIRSMRRCEIAVVAVCTVVAGTTDAAEVVALFERSLAAPADLAASVSTRKDVVLYGSEMKERYVGGAKVRAQLKKWNLAFEVRDGIQAGVTSNKKVTWVAANVDGRPAKKPTARAIPYRVLFIYEQTGTNAWQLVQAHFSFVAS